MPSFAICEHQSSQKSPPKVYAIIEAESMSAAIEMFQKCYDGPMPHKYAAMSRGWVTPQTWQEMEKQCESH